MDGEGDSDVKFMIGRSAGRSAVIAGFIATHIATMAGLWFGGARLPTFNFNQLNGLLVFGTSYGFTHPFETFVVGGILHYISGIIWAVIFALVVHPALGRAIKPLAALTPVNNYIKGIIWGIALWIISSALWMPLLIDPLFGGGVVGPFLTKFGLNGVQALFSNLLWHSIYGANLGLLFNPVPSSAKSVWKTSASVAAR